MSSSIIAFSVEVFATVGGKIIGEVMKMKMKALKNHECFCCRKVIVKGEECLVFMNLPENPAKREFELLYAHLRCVGREAHSK